MTIEIAHARTASSSLGFHAIPLKGAAIVRHMLNGPAPLPWPNPPGRAEVYAYLRQRFVNRVRAAWASRWLYATDIAMAGCAFLLAALVRLDLDGSASAAERFRLLLGVLPWFLLICGLVFPFTCLYRRNWRYASVRDLLGVVRAVVITSLGFVFCLFVVGQMDAIPRSIALIQTAILVPLLLAPRMRFKFADTRRVRSAVAAAPAAGGDSVPVLLIGAGDVADLYLQALQREEGARHRPVGILDRVAGTEGFLLRGVPILGSLGDFETVVADLTARGCKPRHLIFTETVSGFTDPDTEALIDKADQLGIAISRPAPVLELRNPKSENRLDLRPIELTDLLERPQAALDKEALRRMIEGCRVVVTGAGGSIGRELTLQVAALRPAEIVLIENSEYNLYAVDMELSESFPAVPRTAYLCNVRDAGRLGEIFDRHRPELVFHAAALKHVPMVELNPCEGILTNVIGTRNVADAARRCGARAFVQISTDKVVNATSVMGATKRLAELYCQALDLAGTQDDARFMTVRFGNVLGSSGSLIPLFERQLARGGPLTVTDPAMTRYFMTIREAVELTLQASSHGLEKGLGRGEIFVLDMGEPIRIVDMARRMIKLAGYRPDEEIKIEIIGCRPGEKLFEELFDTHERRVASPVPGVLGAIPDAVPLEDLQQAFAGLQHLAATGDMAGVVASIAAVLPSYQGAPGNAAAAVRQGHAPATSAAFTSLTAAAAAAPR
jgi:FlaA1/EpsC-like NDP-sugar epimerase